MTSESKNPSPLEEAVPMVKSAVKGDGTWPVTARLQALLDQSMHELPTKVYSANDIERAVMDHNPLASYAVRLALLGEVYAGRYWKSHWSREKTLFSENARSLFFNSLSLEFLPRGYSEFGEALHDQLSRNFLQEVVKKKDKTRMQKAVYHARTVLALNKTRNFPRYAQQVLCLAVVLCQQHNLFDSRQSLEESINLLKDLLARDNIPNMEDVKIQLSCSYRLRYSYTGALQDLNESIEIGIKLLESIGSVHQYYVTGACLVGEALTVRYKRYNDASDIQRAKVLLRQTVHTFVSDSQRYITLICMFCMLLLVSFESTNNVDDLSAGIQIAQRGTNVEDHDFERLARVRNTLALLLTRRYERLGTATDRENAFEYFQSAWSYARNTDMNVEVANDISLLYKVCFTKTQDLQNLKYALMISLAVVKQANVFRNPQYWLNGIDTCIRLYQSQISQKEYLNSGLRLADQALSYTPKWKSDHWAELCAVAGTIYELKYSTSKDAEDFNSALTLQLEAWNTKGAPLGRRLRSIDRACSLLIEANRWSEAWSWLRDIEELIPLYCATSVNRQDQQLVISDLPRLASLACSAGLVVGDVHGAIEIWEKCRGMIVSSSYHAVRELSRLKAEYFNLYEKFLNYRSIAFEGSATKYLSNISSLDNSYLDLSQRRTDALSSLKQLVLEIRNDCSSFGDFLVPLNIARMQALAVRGAIVVLNSSKYRAHAILVTQKEIQSIELLGPSTDPDIFKENGQLNLLMDLNLERHELGSLGDGRSQDSVLGDLLRILWLHVVKPVCDVLGLTAERMREITQARTLGISMCRIRWLTGGLFSRLPLHAARMEPGERSESTMSRAISSYAISFRMLEYVSEKLDNIKNAEYRGLIASMSSYSKDRPQGEPNIFIGSAEEQIRRMEEACKSIQWTTLRRRSAATILDQLPHYPFVHFIAHGRSHLKDPSQSCLVFMEDGNGSQGSIAAPDYLTVDDLFHCSTENAVLAFLVACNTGDSRVPTLVDEGLNIVNAFQVAGFPHVIGSLWPVLDPACPPFVEYFYTGLEKFNSDSTILTNDGLALAVHHAQSCLQAKYKDRYRKWAGFIYMGP